MEDYSEYLKDWCDLYIHFCWHKSKTPREITDEVLFKKEFTYERWKQGFSRYKTSKVVNYKINNELSSVNLKNFDCNVEYSLYRFVPFNIKYNFNTI
jgi:hypothetical protein